VLRLQRDGKINRQEALTVSSLLAAATSNPNTRKTTPAAYELWRCLSSRRRTGSGDHSRFVPIFRRTGYEQHRLHLRQRCPIPRRLADVIFISLVDTAQRGPLSLPRQELFKQRLTLPAAVPRPDVDRALPQPTERPEADDFAAS